MLINPSLPFVQRLLAKATTILLISLPMISQTLAVEEPAAPKDGDGPTIVIVHGAWEGLISGKQSRPRWKMPVRAWCIESR